MICSWQFLTEFRNFTLTVVPRTATRQPCFFGSHTISSEEGPQQGDPLDPLLFCNTIHTLLSSLASELNLGYVDDVTLGGPVDTVASDVAEIAKVGGKMGLILNSCKCELPAHPEVTVNDKRLQRFQ